MNSTTSPSELFKHHILQRFDGELCQLHDMTLKMMHLIMNQWELAIESLQEANLSLALELIAEQTEIKNYENKIDQLILTLLAKENPVASDLRIILSLSKISVELKYLGEEINEIAKLILALYEPRNGVPNAQLLADIERVIEDIRNVLGNLIIVLGSMESKQAHLLLQYDYVCAKELEESVHRQLLFIHADQRQIRPALTILQVMKSLESSGEHCKNLAEYCIMMIDGQDMRHSPN